ncbi:MAG TPA: shikimate dehydrogenase [Pyrinomonadaceae bacterium]|nr:shikimate dehydrogenase [Pyrinomonadaceae bacterium]
MNDGKICVSVCAETADELIEQIKRAESLADVIEIRFDCLEATEFESALQKISNLKFEKPFLATFRPRNKYADLTPAKRLYKNDEERELHRINSEYRYSGWEKILKLKNIDYVDFEYDIHSKLLWNMMFINFWGTKFDAKRERELALKLKGRKLIFSEHYFLREVIDLEETFRRLAEEIEADNDEPEEKNFLNPAIIKIAAQADEITNTIPIWRLLEKAKSENKQIIPIAMGEAGKWTRILGLAHGAFMTYAALDEKSATAPGQITAREMIEVYRVRELNEQTEVYGIIGGNTSYSKSPYLQNAAFKYRGLNAVFVPLQVRNLDEFVRRMVKPETREIELNFKGFAVTIPHKTEIIKYLDEIDRTAQEIGAVNTVKIENGKLYGYNTDAQGFIKPLKNSFRDLKNAKVAVLGAGGAARACVYALKKEGAEVMIFVRNIERAKTLAEEFQVKLRQLSTNNQQRTTNFNDFDILVNATPLGTKGEFENETPAFADEIKNVSLCYDLVYNPQQTRFLREAESVNIPTIGGLEMLVAQGAEQFKIWTGLEAPIEEMRQSVIRKLQS